MMDIEKYLNNFSKYHGLIANVEIFDSLHVKDKQLRRIIKLYQEKYNADLDCVCLFNESDIEMISESVINHNLRKNIHNGVIPVNILSLNNDYLLRNDIWLFGICRGKHLFARIILAQYKAMDKST